MIKIEAIIRPERVNQVSVALQEGGCRGFHYQNVTGQGQQQGVEVFTGRGGRTALKDLGIPKGEETVVKDEMKEEVINAIISAASSPGEGAIGDGKIFVSFVEDIVRVRTKERGEGAL